MIPIISEREFRPCHSTDDSLSCVHCISDENGSLHCNFNMIGESGYVKLLHDARMPNFDEIKIKRYNITGEELNKLPCIYHLTKKEYAETMIGY